MVVSTSAGEVRCRTGLPSSCIGLSTADGTGLNAAADQQIRQAAGRYGDVFADVRAAFAGHEICAASRWLHSVNVLDISESHHPAAAGQSGGYLPVFSQYAG